MTKQWLGMTFLRRAGDDACGEARARLEGRYDKAAAGVESELNFIQCHDGNVRSEGEVFIFGKNAVCTINKCSGETD